MKIRLIEQGYEKFTGLFGNVEFEDGVSVSDVSDSQARFFAAIVMVRCEDGTDPGANAAFQRALNDSVVVVDIPTQAELDAQMPVKIVEESKPIGYTREQLEQIADKSGIRGLREISDGFGVKGTDIKKLINAILNAQMKGLPVTQTVAGVPVEGITSNTVTLNEAIQVTKTSD